MYLKETGNIGNVRIKYFPMPVDYFYYELFLVDSEVSEDENEDEDGWALNNQPSRPILKIVDHLSPVISNTLQFVYKQKVLVSRQLSDYEVQIVLEVLNAIKLHINMSPEKMVGVEPDGYHEIYFQSDQITAKYSWLTSDVLSNPKKMKDLKKITELLLDMLNVDYSKLDMPKYL